MNTNQWIPHEGSPLTLPIHTDMLQVPMLQIIISVYKISINVESTSFRDQKLWYACMYPQTKLRDILEALFYFQISNYNFKLDVFKEVLAPFQANTDKEKGVGII